MGLPVHHYREQDEDTVFASLEAVPPRAVPQVAGPVGVQLVGGTRPQRLDPADSSWHVRTGTKAHGALSMGRWSRHHSSPEL